MPLTDSRLATLARKYNAYQQQYKDAEAGKKDIAKRVIAELDRRGKRIQELTGLKITKVTPTETDYDFDKLERLIGRKMARLVQVRKVDKDLLAAQLTAGTIDPAIVAQCTVKITKSSYISVS